jgi:hypothetical protein
MLGLTCSRRADRYGVGHRGYTARSTELVVGVDSNLAGAEAGVDRNLAGVGVDRTLADHSLAGAGTEQTHCSRKRATQRWRG